MIKKYLYNRAKYSIYANLAKFSASIYMFAPNDVIGDFFYSVYKKANFNAHTSRVLAQKEFENVKKN